jgi:hypothetical protein
VSVADRLKGWFAAWPSKRVKESDLLSAMEQVCPEITFGERRQQLLTALNLLAEEGVVVLPKAKSSWSAFGTPSLPNTVSILRTEAVAPAAEEAFAWLPELAFAVEARHTAQREKLRTLNDFLIANPEVRQGRVPYRERSLQIFGDEKFFDTSCGLRDGALWGKLPLASLGAYAPEHPLPREDFPGSSRACMLVVENLHTFETLVVCNRREPEYRSIVMGSGNAVLGSAGGIRVALERSGSEQIEYFGDLDPEGVRIAARLADTVKSTAGLEMLPAVRLYRGLLEIGVRRALGAPTVLTARSAEWLQPTLASKVMTEWAAGQWLPQEGLSFERLPPR